MYIYKVCTVIVGFYQKTTVDDNLVYDVCGQCCCCISNNCRHKAKLRWHCVSKEDTYVCSSHYGYLLRLSQGW